MKTLAKYVLICLCCLAFASYAYGQGTTTAEYYQYQRDQAFKKYMETTGSQGMAGSAKTNFNNSLDKKATDKFVELMIRRNQGNKVIETEEQKRTIRAQVEMDKLDAQIKLQNKLANEKALKEALSKVRTINLRNGEKFEGYFLQKSSSNIELIWGKLTYSSDAGSGYYQGYFGQHYGQSLKYGEGTEVLRDGTVYSGGWYEDFKHGFGMLKMSNGDVYVGNFKNGRYFGIGSLTHADGRVETGFWDSGEFTADTPPYHESYKYEDKGKKKLDNGRRLSGVGKIKYSDGDFIGEFKNYNRHGKGKFTWKDGSSYTGDYFYDNIHGKGILKWANGNKYEGEWANNGMHGKGKFTWLDGSVYIGDFENSKKHGKGKLIYANGSVDEGTWEYDTFKGK